MATILLVDDVALFLELERSFLEGSGHHIVTASSGEEALRKIEVEQPALVLLDLFMPGIDGDEVCRRLRGDERWRELPVIMVTAAGKDQEIRRCLSAGCNDYVTKPINKADLLEKVGRLLGTVKGRINPRVEVPMRVQIKADGQNLSATVKDISRSGLFIRSQTVFAEGAIIDLWLDLPGGRELPMLGKVVRAQQGAEQGMAVYLIHPQPQSLRELERLVADEEGRQALDVDVVDVDAHLKRLAELEQRNSSLAEENLHLLHRITELEEENRTFAQQIVQIEEVNNNLTNLYIASSRLHSVLNRRLVLDIIKEVIINFVGAEKFAILIFHKESNDLRFEVGEGFEPADYPPIGPNDGLLWSALVDDAPYFIDGPVAEGSDDPRHPLAAIPLKIHDETMGMLAIYRLFIQKESFQQVDYQLFSMMAEHAVTALFSSTLYEQSERKRETYRGFMDLLLKQ